MPESDSTTTTAGAGTAEGRPTIENPPRSFEPVRNVVEILSAWHRGVARLCRSRSDSLGDDKRAALLTALAEQQEELVAFLAAGRGAADDRILATRIQFVPSEWIEETLETLAASADEEGRLSSQILRLQDQIVEMLQVVRSGPSSREASRFLHGIVEWEHASSKRASETVLGMKDI